MRPLAPHRGGEVLELARVGILARRSRSRSVPSGRRSSMPRLAPSATGRRGTASRRRRSTSSSDRATMSSPQSNVAEHAARERQRRPRSARRRPSPPIDLAPAHPLGLAGQQPHRAHAVAADVHQPAAVERAPGAARRPAGPCRSNENAARTSRRLPTARSRTSSRSRRACAWWRHMNASASTRSGAVGGVERRLRVLGPPRQRLLAQHVLAGLQRADRPRHVQRVRQRDVDRVDLRVGEQRLVAAVRAAEPVLGRVRLGPRRRRGSPTATASTPSAARAPPRSLRLMLAVESSPRRSVMLVRIARARGARSSRPSRRAAARRR